MIVFIDAFFVVSLNYNQYRAIVHLHTLQFIAAHALEFSVSTSCILAADLNTELSLQITMKSCRLFLFNYLALPTLQNSTKFSNSVSSHTVLDPVFFCTLGRRLTTYAT
jgi:hypothetical protein